MSKKPTIVDLFSGCGGFGLGAELAGFHTVVAVDIDPTLQSAYKKNFPNTRTITQDVSLIRKDDWELALANTEIDGVIGGPPCQGYSRMGLCNPKDPRRTLLKEFFRQVNMIDPKFFVMENVEGLLDKKNRPQLEDAMSIIDEKFEVLPPQIVDASEWGAPTKRKRVIVVGFNPLKISPVDLIDFVPPKITTSVRDAISDFKEPIPQSEDKVDLGWNGYRRLKNISEYAQKMRRLPAPDLGDAFAKKQLLLGKSSGHFDTVHHQAVIERFFNTPQGKTDVKSRAKKLHWEGLCPTLRAGTGSDKGSFSSVRPIHPSKGRVISVREAARLQGFPDWFVFHPTKWHSFRMIGNSVSPIVSEGILGVLYHATLAARIKKSA
ncbi:DNA cytosine methyltransferase [Marinobacter sp.]|jgi:DNA (cytosine-5)-methyltransferase 1|uniref:DNA cytosine methyltransferase n=1 Tax=Marinobacter sp. TaxID=50741 RepID=UPI000C630A6A|nr:DNA cytosine methyltransferase [Marinobacter sp.]MBE96637.1 DNA (cytosine-5-)-methyltransferase [Marinobacter sp.]MBP55349.1 DNA (cytosine-5-)-methyltransferase [Marinobacter sp.]|tara:strand:- start:2627 stop:3760 length:1134 start_codon:yes stop_codon:yes gene_type:complete